MQRGALARGAAGAGQQQRPLPLFPSNLSPHCAKPIYSALRSISAGACLQAVEAGSARQDADWRRKGVERNGNGLCARGQGSAGLGARLDGKTLSPPSPRGPGFQNTAPLRAQRARGRRRTAHGSSRVAHAPARQRMAAHGVAGAAQQRARPPHASSSMPLSSSSSSTSSSSIAASSIRSGGRQGRPGEGQGSDRVKRKS